MSRLRYASDQRRRLRELCLLGLVLLAACTPEEQSAVEKVSAARGEAERDLPAVLGAELAEARYDVEGLAARGVLRVLVGYSHTHYFMDGLRIRGITAEKLRRFEPFLNERLGRPKPRVAILPVPVARDEMIDFLDRGLADLALGNITVTQARERQVDFSEPVRDDVAEVVVANRAVADLTELADLSDRIVHVRRSSSFAGSIERLNERFDADGLPPVRVTLIDEHLQTEDVLELVNAGVIDITVADDYLAEFWSGVYRDIVVRHDLALETGRRIAWAIRRDFTGMKPIVDEFVAEHREGTLVGNVLFRRYLENNRYVHNAAASADRSRLLSMMDIFRRYSDEYDFDWLLIAAQAYQESRLIQSKKSPAGAIGVMQLLPVTAMAAPVGIPNIEDLEANIHAGHKYLRHITDRYLSDPGIDELDRHLLAFAAYNAGPTRISRLRRLAPEEGVDPDVWFGQMERLVAREVGMEPVTYVRNIFKYYVTYKLMQDSLPGS